jgi:uncharacterized ferritin-like protein (DUF455 family)
MGLRRDALRVLVENDPDEKSRLARALDPDAPPGSGEQIAQPAGLPGRPGRPELVAHTQLKPRSMKTAEGRAALLHALAHIELNAIDLAADLVWRFAGMPDAFYREWTIVAREEALHFQLLRDRLRSMDFDYGSFPAHNALWEMAEKTQGDLLARIALVPRTLEARGLDASPPIKAKLVAAGDLRSGEILDVILRDEIGHVAVGNRWYRLLCGQRGLDPIATYRELAGRYGAPRPRGPFNLEARRTAGFDEDELAALLNEAPDQPRG